MRRLSMAIGRPVTFALLQVVERTRPVAGAHGRVVASLRRRRGAAVAAGGGAGHGPAVGPAHHVLSVRLRSPPTRRSSTRGSSDPELVRALRDPAVREAIVSFEPEGDVGRALHDAYAVNVRAGFATRLRARARALAGSASPPPPAAIRSRSPTTSCSKGTGTGLLYFPILNYASMSLEPVREMLLHPRAVAGLGDGGAHCGVICDSSQPTFMLSHWTRDRTPRRTPAARMGGEEADPRHRPALRPRLTGAHSSPACWPTSTSSTTSTCSSGTPKVVDRPARRRTAARAGRRRYLATIKSGRPPSKTGATPGHVRELVRGAR